MEKRYFNDEERARLPQLLLELGRHMRGATAPGDLSRLRRAVTEAVEAGSLPRDRHGINPVIHNIKTAIALSEVLGADSDMLAALMLHNISGPDGAPADVAAIRADWGDDTATLVEGLTKVGSLYSKRGAVMSENFRNLLLTFARDIRVIIIMIVERLVLMQTINHHPDEQFVRDVAYEASYLYAPLAHRLGLYSIKSLLEDLSLKYIDRPTYTSIARQLNETKQARDAYIASFIDPVKKRLADAGLKFEIKGRTKSIYSIYNKIKKQNNDLDHIYDLFAIRVILDVPPEKEKSSCWLAYSLVTDMYQPNPARMKDWISIPKSNGYESLHITVKGPEGRWVEVQIRTRRMDLIAEKGLAAHWRYKGIKSEEGLDAWISNIRDILETAGSGPMELMKNIKMDIYSHEVFVFTPRGDLHRLPQGATVLDFAFSIHSGLGCTCTGAIVNGRHRRLNYKLQSGDTVQVTTSPQQAPKQDWLNIAVTTKARSKIRATLNERAAVAGELAREMLMRRFKNRKIEVDEGTLSKVIKRMGFKTATDFYLAIAEERLDPSRVIAQYELFLQGRDAGSGPSRSAEEFTMPSAEAAVADHGAGGGEEPLVIGGGDIRGLSYRLARCCNPVHGDPVFGFISAEGTVKIHRDDCPNASNIRQRYPYRVIPVRWSGRVGGQAVSTLRIVGNDDLGIVTNITSIIAKEKGAYLRNISIDSSGGMFRGYLVVGVDNTQVLSSLIKKIKTVKGVKEVARN